MGFGWHLRKTKYIVTVEDVTLADGTKAVDYVVDTKYNVR
jgi:hypothetical protein